MSVEPGGPDPFPVEGDAPPSDVMVLAGRLEDSSFVDLLRQLIVSRDTAVFELSQGSLRKSAWILEGRIVFATSSDPDDRLGECMLREGIISLEQYDASAKLIRPGKRQGTILVEMGHCMPEDLVRGVERQVERIIHDMFQWRAGDYRIELRPFDTGELIQLAISTEQLVFEGVKRAVGWSQVRRGLGNLEVLLIRAPDADVRLHRLDLNEDEMHAYSLANGRVNVAQCCAMSYASAHDTCVTLYGLACCGLLVPVTLTQAEEARRSREAGNEFVGIHDRVRGFDNALAGLRPALQQALGDRTDEFYDAVLADVLDEHHDVLRDVRLAEGLSLALIVENLEPVDPGRRCLLVERALVALEQGLVKEVANALGPAAGEQVAAVFGSPGRST